MDELARRPRQPKTGHGGSANHYGGVNDPLTHPPRLRGATHHHAAHQPPRSQTTHHPAHHPPHQGHHAGRHTHEPALSRDHATVVSFDGGSYTATITLARSPDVTIAGVPVSRAIPAATIAAGQVAAVLFFDRHNNADAMIVGVW